MIELLITIVRRTDYSDRIDVTDMTAGQVIEYGLELGVIERQEHRLGSIIRTDPTNAVLLTYFRNNTAHLLAMTTWIACCFPELAQRSTGPTDQTDPHGLSVSQA